MVNKKVSVVVCLLAVLALAACSRQQSDWEKTRAANTTDAYELFIKKYPSGEFTQQAQARAKELYEERDWQKARDADTIEAYQAFLKQYPEGKWTEEARIRVENFTLASAPSNSTPASAASPPPPTAAPNTAPAPSAAPKPSTAMAAIAAPKGHYGVQLGAFKSGGATANKRWAELQKQYPMLLTGLTPKVSPRKISSGTLYRLQVADLSEKRASSICSTLKAHAQPCVLLHP
jgi:cell division protein FtsN